MLFVKLSDKQIGWITVALIAFAIPAYHMAESWAVGGTTLAACFQVYKEARNRLKKGMSTAQVFGGISICFLGVLFYFSTFTWIMVTMANEFKRTTLEELRFSMIQNLQNVVFKGSNTFQDLFDGNIWSFLETGGSVPLTFLMTFATIFIYMFTKKWVQSPKPEKKRLAKPQTA